MERCHPKAQLEMEECSSVKGGMSPQRLTLVTVVAVVYLIVVVALMLLINKASMWGEWMCDCFVLTLIYAMIAVSLLWGMESLVSLLFILLFVYVILIVFQRGVVTLTRHGDECIILIGAPGDLEHEL